MILSSFRSAAADVSARFLAKDMYTASRASIEEAIQQRMIEIVGPRGFLIEAVLLKSIQLPPRVVAAVELKLAAEQDAERMQFVLQQERLEAERKAIEAEGVRQAQVIVGEAITDDLLRWQGIEALRELSTSPNAKIVVMSGDNPLLMDVVSDSR